MLSISLRNEGIKWDDVAELQEEADGTRVGSLRRV
jgi:hypothetical protein